MFHRFEATDHRLDAGPNLLVLLQQVGPLGRQRILTLLERLVLVLQLVADAHEGVDPFLESLQFLLERRRSVIGHGANIVTGSSRINRDFGRGSRHVTWYRNPWDHCAPAILHDDEAMEETPDHATLDAALRRCGASWDAAQTHGLLAGRLATAGAAAGFDWLNQVLEGTADGDALRTECERLLGELFQTTYRQLAERQSEFEPLLPDDTESTVERASALAHWCEGFLNGLVSQDHADALRARLAQEPLAEIIRDVLQLTRAAADDEAEVETDEAAYAEIVEYLRVVAQLTYEELAGFRDAYEATAAGGNAVH